MARRKKEKVTYKYECSLSGEKFYLTRKMDNKEDLMSVNSWYEMNPEKDDRPEAVKKKLGLNSED